jgi:hypothetical protein
VLNCGAQDASRYKFVRAWSVSSRCPPDTGREPDTDGPGSPASELTAGRKLVKARHQGGGRRRSTRWFHSVGVCSPCWRGGTSIAGPRQRCAQRPSFAPRCPSAPTAQAMAPRDSRPVACAPPWPPAGLDSCAEPLGETTAGLTYQECLWTRGPLSGRPIERLWHRSRDAQTDAGPNGPGRRQALELLK